MPRIYIVQAFRNRVSILLLQKLRNRLRVQLTSRHAQPTGGGFRESKKFVRHGDGGLHPRSITQVIPEACWGIRDLRYPSLLFLLFFGAIPVHFRWMSRIHIVQAFGNRVSILLLQKLRKRLGIELTSGDVQAAGGGFRASKQIVRHGDGGLHTRSITRVIPGACWGIRDFSSPSLLFPSLLFLVWVKRGGVGCGQLLRAVFLGRRRGLNHQFGVEGDSGFEVSVPAFLLRPCFLASIPLEDIFYLNAKCRSQLCPGRCGSSILQVNVFNLKYPVARPAFLGSWKHGRPCVTCVAAPVFRPPE